MREDGGDPRPKESTEGGTADAVELAAMQAVCEDAIGVIAKCLCDESISRPMDMVELYAFGMAVVTNVYPPAKGGLAAARPGLDAFHSRMTVVVANEVFQKHDPDISDVHLVRRCDYFTELLIQRYPGYQEAFRRSITQIDPHVPWLRMSELLVDRLFGEPLTEVERTRLILRLALAVAQIHVSAFTLLAPAATAIPGGKTGGQSGNLGRSGDKP